MRILTVLTYYRPHYSGLTIYAERLARALAQRGHHVTVLTSRYDTRLPEREVLDGVEIVRLKVGMHISKGVIMPSMPLLGLAAGAPGGCPPPARAPVRRRPTGAAGKACRQAGGAHLSLRPAAAARAGAHARQPGLPPGQPHLGRASAVIVHQHAGLCAELALLKALPAQGAADLPAGGAACGEPGGCASLPAQGGHPAGAARDRHGSPAGYGERAWNTWCRPCRQSCRSIPRRAWSFVGTIPGRVWREGVCPAPGCAHPRAWGSTGRSWASCRPASSPPSSTPPR